MENSTDRSSSLLLNAGYEPIHVVSWQRAFTLMFQDKVEVLEHYDTFVNSVSARFVLPAVLILKRWVSVRRWAPIVKFSRTNLYARDEWRCQYCAQKFPDRDLTLDHVIPVAFGGRKTWENIVTACLRCNQRKGHKSPEEADMILLRHPRSPRWVPGMWGTMRTKTPPEIWKPYLILNQKLQSS